MLTWDSNPEVSDPSMLYTTKFANNGWSTRNHFACNIFLLINLTEYP